MRARAVLNALKYGFLPSRLYEDDPHHDLGYWTHLWMNLAYAWRWVTRTETASDRSFENGEPEPRSYRDYKTRPPV